MILLNLQVEDQNNSTVLVRRDSTILHAAKKSTEYMPQLQVKGVDSDGLKMCQCVCALLMRVSSHFLALSGGKNCKSINPCGSGLKLRLFGSAGQFD